MIEFTLAIDPQPKLRPRFSRGRVYTPSKTVAFESSVALLANRFRPSTALLGPLEVSIDFFIKPPQKPKAALPIVKPDIDNFAKSVCDALNGIFWHDDSQICDLRVRKFYDWTTKTGSIRVSISEMKGKE